jgi:hypothetical protein
VSKYDPLYRHLSSLAESSVTMTDPTARRQHDGLIVEGIGEFLEAQIHAR